MTLSSRVISGKLHLYEEPKRMQWDLVQLKLSEYKEHIRNTCWNPVEEFERNMIMSALMK